MKPGDIVLIQGQSPISMGINWVTRGGFSHAAIATSEGTIIEAVATGVREVPLRYERYAVYEVIGITDEEREAIVEFARSLLPYEYDFLQDLGFFLNFLRKVFGLKRIAQFLDMPWRIICSALVDEAFRSQGIVLREDLDPGDITPIGLTYTSKVHFLENHGLWEV